MTILFYCLLLALPVASLLDLIVTSQVLLEMAKLFSQGVTRAWSANSVRIFGSGLRSGGVREETPEEEDEERESAPLLLEEDNLLLQPSVGGVPV